MVTELSGQRGHLPYSELEGAARERGNVQGKERASTYMFKIS